MQKVRPLKKKMCLLFVQYIYIIIKLQANLTVKICLESISTIPQYNLDSNIQLSIDKFSQIFMMQDSNLSVFFLF